MAWLQDFGITYSGTIKHFRRLLTVCFYFSVCHSTSSSLQITRVPKEDYFSKQSLLSSSRYPKHNKIIHLNGKKKKRKNIILTKFLRLLFYVSNTSRLVPDSNSAEKMFMIWKWHWLLDHKQLHCFLIQLRKAKGWINLFFPKGSETCVGGQEVPWDSEETLFLLFLFALRLKVSSLLLLWRSWKGIWYSTKEKLGV